MAEFHRDDRAEFFEWNGQSVMSEIPMKTLRISAFKAELTLNIPLSITTRSTKKESICKGVRGVNRARKAARGFKALLANKLNKGMASGFGTASRMRAYLPLQAEAQRGKQGTRIPDMSFKIGS